MSDERELAESALAQRDAQVDSDKVQWPPVARRAREARERLGLSEADVAARLGIRPSEYWDIERYDSEAFDVFDVELLTRLSSVLGMSLDALLFGSNDAHPISRTPYRVVVERLLAAAAREGLTIEQLSDRVGWDLTAASADHAALGQLPVSGLRDVCRAAGVDWVTVLPRV